MAAAFEPKMRAYIEAAQRATADRDPWEGFQRPGPFAAARDGVPDPHLQPSLVPVRPSA